MVHITKHIPHTQVCVLLHEFKSLHKYMNWKVTKTIPNTRSQHLMVHDCEFIRVTRCLMELHTLLFPSILFELYGRSNHKYQWII